MLQVAQKLHYILTRTAKFAIRANQVAKPISKKENLNAVTALGSFTINL